MWKRRGGPWYSEKESHGYTPSSAQNAYCEFSFMTWKDGLDDLRRSGSDMEKPND
jgi:hypothetical protein